MLLAGFVFLQFAGTIRSVLGVRKRQLAALHNSRVSPSRVR